MEITTDGVLVNGYNCCIDIKLLFNKLSDLPFSFWNYWLPFKVDNQTHVLERPVSVNRVSDSFKYISY